MDEACLPPTRALLHELQRINNFIWPTAAALWNFRWQVKGFSFEAPNATSVELNHRFTSGSGISRVDFKYFNTMSWTDQLEQLGEMALVSYIGLFEGWLVEIQDFVKIDQKAIQWPSKSVGLRKTKSGVPQDGIVEALAKVGVGSSPHMSKIYGHLSNRKHCSPKTLDGLLTCYRYWKEVRNSMVHQNRRASMALVDAQSMMSKLTVAETGTKVIPNWSPMNIGDNLAISLQGVMGFAEVILKIVVTLDVLLSSTKEAEVAFVKSWRKSFKADRRTLPGDKKRRLERLASIGAKSDFGRPAPIQDLEDMLKSHGLATRI